MDPLTEARYALNRLLKRCGVCPSQSPACGSCPSGQVCVLIPGDGCNSCPSTACQSVPGTSGSSKSKSSSSSAGEIAGGVVGGVAFIAIVVWLFWRFWVKKRRQQQDDLWPMEEDGGVEKDDNGASIRRSARQSTQTVASTSTRQSNVIQIAYIPGVTNRSVESTPGLAPPVPPIPAASQFSSSSAASSPHMPGSDQHYFLPNLRDSTWSDDYSIRSSIARNSVHQPPTSASKAVMARGKATSVSVKSSKHSPVASGTTTPAMPAIPAPPAGLTIPPLSTKSSIVGRMATPKQVTVMRSPSQRQAAQLNQQSSIPSLRTPHDDGIHELSGDERNSPVSNLTRSGNTSETGLGIVDRSHLGLQQIAEHRDDANVSPQYSNDSSTFDDASSTDSELYDAPRAARRSLMGHDRNSAATTVIQDSPMVDGNGSMGGSYNQKFNSMNTASGSAGKAKKQNHKKSRSLNQIIEEAAMRAQREPMHGGLGSSIETAEPDEGAAGPFDDVHIAKTP